MSIVFTLSDEKIKELAARTADTNQGVTSVETLIERGIRLALMELRFSVFKQISEQQEIKYDSLSIGCSTKVTDDLVFNRVMVGQTLDSMVSVTPAPCADTPEPNTGLRSVDMNPDHDLPTDPHVDTTTFVEIRAKCVNQWVYRSFLKTVHLAKRAHMIDIKVRHNGQDHWYEADWMKHVEILSTTNSNSDESRAATSGNAGAN